MLVILQFAFSVCESNFIYQLMILLKTLTAEGIRCPYCFENVECCFGHVEASSRIFYYLFIYFLFCRIKLALWMADSTQVNSKGHQISSRFLVTAKQWTPKWVISSVYSWPFILISECGQSNKYKESNNYFLKLQKRCSHFIQT